MTDILIVVILLIIIGGAAVYVIKAKKKGVKCIGCPSGATCGRSCSSGGCSGRGSECHGQEEE